MKTNMPIVSIIIPTLNRACLIPETLDSIIALTYKNWECIIVDDGSCDNTSEIVQKYLQKDKRFKFYNLSNKYKSGANGARNFGFEVSKGEYIQWFDSDDIMLKDFLSDKIDVFIKHREYQTVTSRVTFFEGNRNLLKEQLGWNSIKDSVYKNVILGYTPILTPGIMFRKSFLLATKEKLDESLIFEDEHEFFSRIFIKHPHKSYFIDKSFALVRRNGEDSVTTVFFKGESLMMNESAYLAQSKIIELLIQTNKFSRDFVSPFYFNHKKYLSIAYKHSQHELVNKYKSLIEKYLIFSDDIFTLAKFRLGYLLMRTFPVDNFFLYYKHTPFLHSFNKHITRNINRIYNLLCYKKWRSEKLKKNKTKIISLQYLLFFNSEDSLFESVDSMFSQHCFY